MTMNAYMKVTDIKGECKSADHEDEIDLFNVEWLLEQETHANLGSGRMRGRATINPIYVYKWYDASSPYLALTCMQGKSIEEIVIMVRKDAGDAHLDFLQITLKNSAISTYEVCGEYKSPDGTETKALYEKIGIASEHLKVKYIVQAEDHTAGDEHEIEYDVVQGK